jgi:DUF4097 and DUF4098 domain-containing protein YvlB
VTISEQAGTLTVTSRCPAVPVNRCSVDITATVPSDTGTSVADVNGNVSVTGLNGRTVQLTTKNGNLDLLHLMTSVVTCTSTNGNIDLSDLRAADVDCSTRNGDVTARFTAVDDVTLGTTNGNIDASLPAPLRASLRSVDGNVTAILPAGSYAFDLATTNGHTNKDGLVEDAASKHHITAHTTNGDIDLHD